MNRRQRRAVKTNDSESPVVQDQAANAADRDFASAVDHHNAGRLAEAERLYGRILKAAPMHSGALYRLGIIALQKKQYSDAVDLIGRAIAGNPDDAEALNNLGYALLELGRLDDAMASFQEALAVRPDYAEAHNNLGIVLHQQGRQDEARASYRQALAVRPDFVEAHDNLGKALKEQGRLDDAIASYREALRIQPDHAKARLNLGNAFRERGRLDEAMASYREVLAVRPDYAEAHNNLGIVLYQQGRQDEAMASYREALTVRPDYAQAHNNLGIVLHQQGRLDDAMASYREAIGIKPDFAGAHNNLGNALMKRGRLDEAMACYREALGIEPDFAEAHSALGNALRDQGRPDDAIASYREALRIKPDYAAAHSNLLLAEQYRIGVTAARLKQSHDEWEDRHGAPLHGEWRDHGNSRDPDRRLRIGLVSADLGHHPVGYLLVRLLENKPREGIEFVCYCGRKPDNLTERFMEASDAWVDTRGISDTALANRIRSDRIDILLDLSGHMANNRLLVFARKPAPVQVTWLGYMGTTGLAAMDYLLSDRHQNPKADDHLYAEKVIRMPDGFVCYDPPSYAPPVGPSPFKRNGFITFGCFNNPAKINDGVMTAWADIIDAVPNSRLVLKYRNMDAALNRDRILSLFAGRGVETSRLVLEGKSPHRDLLGRYNGVDIALDPFPYSGSTTTCEALWMGVPVITKPGETFAGRHSLSHLSTVGHPELVARDEGHYVDLAVALATDRARLAGLRSRLRERMAKSPLCEGAAFARHFTSVMREVWQRWCSL